MNIPTPKSKQANCAKHGDYESKCYFGNTWTQCSECVEAQLAAERILEQKRVDDARIAAWQKKLGMAGIPIRFHDRALESFIASSRDQQNALDFARRYAAEFDQDASKTGRSAIFVGKPGTGKTHLAVGIGLRLMQQKRSVLFTTVMRAIRRVKETWQRDSQETESDAVKALAFPDLLILDEVGVQFGSDTEKLILFDVLNDRYENRKPTLLLSNLTVDGVKAHLGERIFDRLREDGGECIPFDWQSYRAK